MTLKKKTTKKKSTKKQEINYIIADIHNDGPLVRVYGGPVELEEAMTNLFKQEFLANGCNIDEFNDLIQVFEVSKEIKFNGVYEPQMRLKLK